MGAEIRSEELLAMTEIQRQRGAIRKLRELYERRIAWGEKTAESGRRGLAETRARCDHGDTHSRRFVGSVLAWTCDLCGADTSSIAND